MKKKKRNFKEIIGSNKPTLVDFYADWCGPCKMMNPVLQQLAGELKGRVNIIKIDVDKNQHLAQKLNVRGVPTLIIYKKGKIVWRSSGVSTALQLKNILKQYYEEAV